MQYWSIILENYEGSDNIFYFENYEIAKANFDRICELNHNCSEFQQEDDNSYSWFEYYNEYSTYVTLELSDLIIHNKLIF